MSKFSNGLANLVTNGLSALPVSRTAHSYLFHFNLSKTAYRPVRWRLSRCASKLTEHFRNFLWDLALSKLYSNCLLSTLNARASLNNMSSSNSRHRGLSGLVHNSTFARRPAVGQKLSGRDYVLILFL